MPPVEDDAHLNDSHQNSMPCATRTVSESAVLIVFSIAFSILLAWLLSKDFMIDVLAVVINLASVYLGIALGVKVYRRLEIIGYPPWARISVAIILGFAATMLIMALTHSHKLVSHYKILRGDYEN